MFCAGSSNGTSATTTTATAKVGSSSTTSSSTSCYVIPSPASSDPLSPTSPSNLEAGLVSIIFPRHRFRSIIPHHSCINPINSGYSSIASLALLSTLAKCHIVTEATVSVSLYTHLPRTLLHLVSRRSTT